MKRTLIIDTSTLLQNPAIVAQSKANTVAIPVVVLKQLDGLKKSSVQAKAYASRRASRSIEKHLKSGGDVRIVTDWIKMDLLDNNSDNQVIGTALWLKQNGYGEVTLLSTDTNMRIAAEGAGIATGNGRSAWSTAKYIVVPVVMGVIWLATILSLSAAIPNFDSGFFSFILGIVYVVITTAILTRGVPTGAYRKEYRDDWDDWPYNKRNEVGDSPAMASMFPNPLDYNGRIQHRRR